MEQINQPQVDRKVIELVAPRPTDVAPAAQVESLCGVYFSGLGCGVNFGVGKDDLLF